MNDPEDTTAPAIKLGEIALARSGDKGNHANIGVVAYTAAGYDFLQQVLTAERVAAYFSQLGATRVVRYELPRLYALNFVLYDALAGGASRSLRIDTQGKLLGTAILELPLPLPANAEEMRRARGPLSPSAAQAPELPAKAHMAAGPAAAAPAATGAAAGPETTEPGPVDVPEQGLFRKQSGPDTFT